jgi:hypothetical protein
MQGVPDSGSPDRLSLLGTRYEKSALAASQERIGKDSKLLDPAAFNYPRATDPKNGSFLTRKIPRDQEAVLALVEDAEDCNSGITQLDQRHTHEIHYDARGMYFTFHIPFNFLALSSN